MLHTQAKRPSSIAISHLPTMIRWPKTTFKIQLYRPNEEEWKKNHFFFVDYITTRCAHVELWCAARRGRMFIFSKQKAFCFACKCDVSVQWSGQLSAVCRCRCCCFSFVVTLPETNRIVRRNSIALVIRFDLIRTSWEEKNCCWINAP